jgi:broad specificity phosphatase PhoE
MIGVMGRVQGLDFKQSRRSKGSGTKAASVSGAITLARHGEPALSRRVKLDSDGYRLWWAQYEDGGLLEGQTPPPLLIRYAEEARHIYSSTRRRSIETAEAVCGLKPFESLDLLVEAPLPPPKLPSFLKFTPQSSQWGTIARFCWAVFDHHQGEESVAEARIRARQAADLLIDKAASGGDVLVLAHGYFNFMIANALKARGYRKTLEQGFKYWGCRRYELGSS